MKKDEHILIHERHAHYAAFPKKLLTEPTWDSFTWSRDEMRYESIAPVTWPGVRISSRLFNQQNQLSFVLFYVLKVTSAQLLSDIPRKSTHFAIVQNAFKTTFPTLPYRYVNLHLLT